MGIDLATPLTAKTSASFPLGFVQQDNQYAVKKQNKTNVNTDKKHWIKVNEELSQGKN